MLKKILINKNKNTVFYAGLILLFVSLAVSGIVLYVKSRNLANQSNTSVTTDDEENKIALYTNNSYGYSIKYPASLRYQLKENEGGYLNFISFLSSPESGVSGFAIGVSSLPLNQEYERIKKTFNESEAELAEDKEDVVKNIKAKRLYYKPKDINFGEERVIVIFNRDSRFTYSISALPEEIGEIVENFTLTTITSPTPTKR